MAGGLGTRYKGLKQIDGITTYGETILEFSIYDALEVGFTTIVIIINSHVPKSYLARLEKIATQQKFTLQFVEQTIEKYVPERHSKLRIERQKPWGTAHAVLCAKEWIKEPFVVINADDYYGKQAFVEIAKSIENNQIQSNQFAMVAYPVAVTLSENGYVSRGICTLHEGYLQTVVEQTNIIREGTEIVFLENKIKKVIPSNTLVSMNFWCFHPAIFTFLETLFHEFLYSIQSDTAEFYIPTLVQHLIDIQNLQVKVLETSDKWYGITYSEDKDQLVFFIKNAISNHLYPNDLWK